MARAPALILPHDWTPRPYQLKPFAALDYGLKRAFLVWHRRAGKDAFAMNYAAKSMQSRPGYYVHMLPQSKQARKVAWMGTDVKAGGRRFIDQAFPLALRKRTLDDEMLIEFKNGAIWQCVGSDNYDTIVGTNIAGVTFSEWSLSNPLAWDYISPIVVENDGWAIFIGTPRGDNHFKKHYERVKDLPDWFVSRLTVLDTGAISLDKIARERAEGKPESRIQQEYFVSWDASNVGSIYLSWITALEKSGKITSVPYDPRFQVETAWDIGHRDAAAIWFVQRVRDEVRVIDYFEERKQTLPLIAKMLRDKPYAYSRHILPHDSEKMEFGAGNTITEQARTHNLNVTIAPKLGIEAGIEATRAMLPRMVFDAASCARGLECLKHYHYEEDDDENDETKIAISNKPDHDWSSHGCDALRYLCVTPEGQGLVPGWAQQYMQQQLGHNGGPPMDYDPLAAYRESSRGSVPQAGHVLGSYPYDPLN